MEEPDRAVEGCPGPDPENRRGGLKCREVMELVRMGWDHEWKAAGYCGGNGVPGYEGVLEELRGLARPRSRPRQSEHVLRTGPTGWQRAARASVVPR